MIGYMECWLKSLQGNRDHKTREQNRRVLLAVTVKGLKERNRNKSKFLKETEKWKSIRRRLMVRR